MLNLLKQFMLIERYRYFKMYFFSFQGLIAQFLELPLADENTAASTIMEISWHLSATLDLSLKVLL